MRNLRLPRRVAAATLLAMTSGVFADDLLIPSYTLDDYVARAIEQGVRGMESQWAFESAGYTREIAFRQTDSPNATVSFTQSHSESETDTTVSQKSLLSSHVTTLTLKEPTPLGTSLTAKGTYGNSGNPTLGTNGLGADANNPAASLSVTQPIYIFVRNSVLRSRRQAELSFANARDTLDSTALSLRSRARGLYYNVMQGEDSIKVEERKVSSSQKLLDITQALVTAGKTAPVETMRAKIRLQSDQRQLENAVSTRETAVLAAKNFVFLPLDQPVHFTTKLQYKALDIPVERLVEFASIHSPSLRTLRRNLELARLDTQAAMEPTRPTLSLNSSYSYSEFAPLEVNRAWSLGGSANWLFFDSFVTRDSTRKARISEEVARWNLADAERTTIVNIRNGCRDIKRIEKQIQDFKNQREQARQNVEVLRLRFQNGLERIIDVFDAENDMRNLDNEYLGLVVQFNSSKDQLSEAIGADVETVR